jgi:radical SAM protein with 4Fe4S-binding SPASM domain
MYLRFKLYIKSLFYHKPIIWPILETVQGLIFALKYFYYYKLLKAEKGLSIKEVNIEFYSRCNLKCKFCSLDHHKPIQMITEDILENFFSDYIKDKRFHNINRINLYNGGEILLHPQIITMLAIVSKYKVIAKEKEINFPEIHLLTNMMLMTELMSKKIIDLDVVDLLGISFDGGNPEDLEAIRINSKWDVIFKNIKDFDRIRKEKGSNVKMSAISILPDDKPLNLKWMHPQFQEAYKILDWYELRRFHNWAGEISEVGTKKKKHKIGCTLLMEQMVILPNGDVTICCNDLNSKSVIGNIMETSFIDVYKSKKRVTFLKLHLQGKKDKIPLCRDCETF